MLLDTQASPHGREINKGLLADAVYDRLLGDIIVGRYLSEERLNVDGIADEFGVSRTPVREALIQLSASGFVEVVRNSRTQVSAWTVCDIRDRLEVVGALVRLTVTDPRFQLEELGERAYVQRQVAGPVSDVHLFLDLAEAIVRAGGNRAASGMLRGLVLPLRLFLALDVLIAHDIDLRPLREVRAADLTAAIGAFRTGDRAETEQLINKYVSALAEGLSPRI